MVSAQTRGRVIAPRLEQTRERRKQFVTAWMFRGTSRWLKEIDGPGVSVRILAFNYAVALINWLSNSSFNHFENAENSSSRPRKSRTICRPGFDPPCSSTSLR